MKIGKVSDYDITIEMSHNKGFIVRVGCGTFVAGSIEILLHDLGEYLEDSGKFMKLYGETVRGSSPLGFPRRSDPMNINTLDGRNQ